MRFFDALPLPNADAAQLVRCFSFFRELNGGASLTQFFTRVWERQPQTFYFEPTAVSPAWYFARLDGNTLVLIDGIRSQADARIVMDGYAGTLQSGYNDPDNPVITREAQSILDQIERLGGFQGENITLCGWSFGGTLAARIPTLRLVTRGNDAERRVISFGAPRVGSESLARRVATEALCTRYMAWNDPIPNYPPRSGTYTWIPFLVGIRASLRFANFVHHSGGINIAEDGSFIDRTVPTDADITPTATLDAFWYGMEANTFSPHALSNYSRLLDLRAGPRPEPNPSPVARTEHRQDTPVADLHRQERGTFSAVRELQQTQEVHQVRIPRERLAVARRVGRVWYVVWNETAIMMTPTRRRAQGLARELNAFLRRMQTTAYVSPASLEQQLQIFLQLAADDQSDIRPTLSTEIPLP